MNETSLLNHKVTVCLKGGTVLGPFNSAWGHETQSDARDLIRDFDEFLKGEEQARFRYHLHDKPNHASHSLIVRFSNVDAIYDNVELKH